MRGFTFLRRPSRLIGQRLVTAESDLRTPVLESAFQIGAPVSSAAAGRLRLRDHLRKQRKVLATDRPRLSVKAMEKGKIKFHRYLRYLSPAGDKSSLVIGV